MPNVKFQNQVLSLHSDALPADTLLVQKLVGEERMSGMFRFDLDIPCDDNWHIWVRGVDQNNMDSYFVAVDAFPNPPGIMELDCTGDPGQATYVWRELNYRDADNGPCEAVQDPWVLPWDAGVHTLEFSYRESLGLSRLYLSNTEQPPP